MSVHLPSSSPAENQTYDFSKTSVSSDGRWLALVSKSSLDLDFMKNLPEDQNLPSDEVIGRTLKLQEKFRKTLSVDLTPEKKKSV